MCLVIFAWKVHPENRLLLAANRDEFHGRPAQELHWWPDAPDLLAGRDLQAGGTWLAVGRSGRFATVTNYREQQTRRAGLQSRGEIVTDFVNGSQSAGEFVKSAAGENYAGFSLLAAADDELWYVSNRGDGPQQLSPGVYGLSNASLDTPWTKLVRTRDGLSSMLDSDNVNETTLMGLLADRSVAPVADVEAGALPFELVRALTAPFIVSAEYGTRCTTTLMWSNAGKITLAERRFAADGTRTGESSFSFDVGAY